MGRGFRNPQPTTEFGERRELPSGVWSGNPVECLSLNVCRKKLTSCQETFANGTSSSAIAETPRCRVGKFLSKLEDDILRTFL